MISPEKLKAKLQSLRDEQYPRPSSATVAELTASRLQQIGSPDALLRDRLIDNTFVRWIEYQQVYSPNQLRDILVPCLNESHLSKF